MIRVLFICHGNICRSPIAEFVMKDMVTKRGIKAKFYIASAATSTEEIWNGIGNPVYPPAKRELAKHGISCEGKRAVQITNCLLYTSISRNHLQYSRITGYFTVTENFF